MLAMRDDRAAQSIEANRTVFLGFDKKTKRLLEDLGIFRIENNNRLALEGLKQIGDPFAAERPVIAP